MSYLILGLDMIALGRSVAVCVALTAFGLAAVAAPAFEGSWTVAQATVNGVPRADGNVRRTVLKQRIADGRQLDSSGRR
jgi:hypothetical protein